MGATPVAAHLGAAVRPLRPGALAPGRRATGRRPLRHCWRTLVAAGGRISVADLAADLGWSRQHLARRFRAEFGAGPKLAARILRFERARKLLQAPPPRRPLAEIALDCGFFDQAHLNRDFTELAGCTPTELLAEELPFVQDAEEPEP